MISNLVAKFGSFFVWILAIVVVTSHIEKKKKKKNMVRTSIFFG